MKIIGGITLFIALTAFNTILNGWCLTILWHWFVETTFGMQPLRIAEAIGVALVVGHLTHQWPENGQEKKDFSTVMLEGLARGVTRPAIALGFGYVVALWV